MDSNLKLGLKHHRSIFLDMAGMHVDAYKSMLRRNQVPLRSEEETQYHAVEAVVLGFADQLALHTGYERLAIKACLEARVDLCLKAIRDGEEGNETFALFYHIDQVGRVIEDHETGDQMEVPSFAAVGSLEQITDAILELSQRRKRPFAAVSILNFGAVVQHASSVFKAATGMTITEAME